MSEFSRRKALGAMGAAVISGAASALIGPHRAHAADLSYQPEKGAELRVLRWKRFVQGDEEQWLANSEKFYKATGVKVRVDSENFEDIRPKAAVAANVGSGPDIVLGWYDDPHQYADKLLDLTELANYLDAKYGGWYDVVRRFCIHDGKWIAIGSDFSAAAWFTAKARSRRQALTRCRTIRRDSSSCARR